MKIRLPSLGADLKHLEAFLELPSHGKVCAGARELTKYGLYKVENCQEHVQFFKIGFSVRISVRIFKYLSASVRILVRILIHPTFSVRICVRIFNNFYFSVRILVRIYNNKR